MQGFGIVTDNELAVFSDIFGQGAVFVMAFAAGRGHIQYKGVGALIVVGKDIVFSMTVCAVWGKFIAFRTRTAMEALAVIFTDGFMTARAVYRGK